MAKITLQSFNGELPRTQAHYLPEGMAVSARNSRLTGGSLRPIRGGVVRHSFGDPGHVAMVHHSGVWHGFEVDVDAVPGPVATDRLYLTKAAGVPEINVSGVWYPLAIPNPTTAPTITATGSPPAGAEAVVYAYTWVTPLGEETGPSPLSNSVAFGSGVTITVAGMPAAVSIGGRPVSNKRIYRARTAASGATDLFLIAELPASAVNFTDVWGANPDMEAIPTASFDPVPATLRGITAMPNGMMAGFSGKELYFCQPYQPHAWPRAFSQIVNENIVGLCAFGSSLAVMTTGNPYLAQGLSPDQMAMVKVEAPYPCVAKRSIVDMGYAAVYACPLGLVQVGEGGANLVSSPIWTKDEWQELQPHTIEAARYGSAYIFSYIPKDAGLRKVAIVNLSGDQPTLVHCDIAAKGFYSDTASTRCYYLDVTGTDVSEFDAGTPLNYTWRSKPYRFTEGVSFGAAAIELAEVDPTTAPGGYLVRIADAANTVILAQATVPSQTTHEAVLSIDATHIVLDSEMAVTVMAHGQAGEVDTQLRVYGDGLLRHTVRPSSGRMIRLPAGRWREWQFELIGTSEVVRLTVAQSPGEIGL